MGSGVKPQPQTILVHEDLETLLMTSVLKCALFYAHDLSFHAHPCFNRAHKIFVYFVSEKNYRTPFSAPLCLRPRGDMSPLPLPTATAVNESIEQRATQYYGGEENRHYDSDRG